MSRPPHPSGLGTAVRRRVPAGCRQDRQLREGGGRCRHPSRVPGVALVTQRSVLWKSTWTVPPRDPPEPVPVTSSRRCRTSLHSASGRHHGHGRDDGHAEVRGVRGAQTRHHLEERWAVGFTRTRRAGAGQRRRLLSSEAQPVRGPSWRRGPGGQMGGGRPSVCHRLSLAGVRWDQSA